MGHILDGLYGHLIDVGKDGFNQGDPRQHSPDQIVRSGNWRRVTGARAFTLDNGRAHPLALP